MNASTVKPFGMAKTSSTRAETNFTISTHRPHEGIYQQFGILDHTGCNLEVKLGAFPFSSFWGPKAGLPSSDWIARASVRVLHENKPDLTLVYLPHLDYDPQRFGPQGCEMPRLVGELDAAAAPLLEAAKETGARVWIVSEYGHVPVSRAVLPNRALREAGLLSVRDGPFGEAPDLFASRAFAVCDHQLAHVYVADTADRPHVRDVLAGLKGVARILEGKERAEVRGHGYPG